LIVLVFTLISASSIALITGRGEGNWPASWPKELEPYRKQAKTIELAAGNQENVYEIRFKNREEFEKLWSTILKLKDKGAPIRLRSIEKTFKKGSLFNDEKPAVRIFSHVWPAGPSYHPGDRKLIPAPPWPDSIKSSTGELPEYVTISEDGMTWVPVFGQYPEYVTVTVSQDWKTLNPVEIKKPRGFIYRARTEIELVVDGTIIDPNRICFPADTRIIDKRKLQTSWGQAIEGLRCRLQADRVVWNAEEIPTFKIQFKNNGKKSFVIHGLEFGIWQNGSNVRWYRRRGKAVEKIIDPNESIQSFDVQLDHKWGNIYSKSPRPLSLSPGSYKVQMRSNRVSIPFEQSIGGPGGQPDRIPRFDLLSNTVEIEILPEQNSAVQI
jgi:hypothetical protein